MTKESLMKYFIFDSIEEKNEAEFYLCVKGIAIHEKIMTQLGVDFSHEEQEVEWAKVSALLRYDKKLRDRIYIYLATLEEYLRAYMSNKYDDYPNQVFWQNGITKKAKVKTRIQQGEKVSDVLESIEFGDLMYQVMNLPLTDIEELFDCSTKIYENLDAVRELRNAVSHHAFLMGYNFKSCIIKGEESDSLEHNIKNLRQLLPEEYKYGKNGNGGITKDIENCQFEIVKNNDSKHLKNKMKLDDKDIVHMI